MYICNLGLPDKWWQWCNENVIEEGRGFSSDIRGIRDGSLRNLDFRDVLLSQSRDIYTSIVFLSISFPFYPTVSHNIQSLGGYVNVGRFWIYYTKLYNTDTVIINTDLHFQSHSYWLPHMILSVVQIYLN